MNNQCRWVIGLISLGVFVAVSSVLSSCSTVTRTVMAPPEIEGAQYVGNKVCAECHTNYARSFPASPHARVHVEGAKMVGMSGCESCHGPGSKHVLGGGGRGKFITNPGKDPTACFQCHLEVHAEFNLPQRHPVIEGKMNCVQCHDPHGKEIMKPAGGLAMARLNQQCAQCHREQTRPFVFEHPALREGCVVCHTPHGSINQKLLVERDANLCLKCHAQIQGTGVASSDVFIGQIPHVLLAAKINLLKQGSCWSAGCHTAVHGSNVSRPLLY